MSVSVRGNGNNRNVACFYHLFQGPREPGKSWISVLTLGENAFVFKMPIINFLIYLWLHMLSNDCILANSHTLFRQSD